MSDPVVVAPPVAETAPAEPVNVLSTLTREQRTKWLMSGDLPETPPTESEAPSAPADVTPPADEKEPAAEPPVESEKSAKTAKPHKPREDTNARFGQLSEKARLATERAEAAERKAADLEAKLNGTAVTPPVTAPPAQPKPPTYVELVKRYESDAAWPKLEEFVAAGLADPYAAMLAAQSAFIGERQFAEREQAKTVEAGRARVRENVAKAFVRAREIGDFDEQALNFDVPSSLVETVMESSLSGELLQYFSKRPAELRTLAATEPLAAARAVGKLEVQLSAPPSSRAATKTTSDAPPPPLTLGSRHTPGAVDEAEEAIASQDFRRYRATMNKRELAATR